MEEATVCPLCASEDAYFDGMLNICPICGHEWNNGEEASQSDVAKDSNGTPLANGDDVTLIKSLKVKGSSITLKQGTKARGIRLTDDPNEVDCRIDGMAIVLKTCFLKKS